MLSSLDNNQSILVKIIFIFRSEPLFWKNQKTNMNYNFETQGVYNFSSKTITFI